MAAKLHFSLVSPERELYAGDVDQVDAPGTEGDFGVLAGHAPFMTTLKQGQVKVYNDGRVRTFEVRGGAAPTARVLTDQPTVAARILSELGLNGVEAVPGGVRGTPDGVSPDPVNVSGQRTSRPGRRRRGGEEARHQDRPANARAGVRRCQRAAGSAIAG